jgi:hypothetical protein
MLDKMSANQIIVNQLKWRKLSYYTLSVLTEKSNKRSWGWGLRTFIVFILHWNDFDRTYGGTLDEKIHNTARDNLEQYILVAEKGDPDAQYDLAVRYASENKFGETGDLLEGAKWIRKAAAQGHPDALNALGVIYLRGICGVQKDEEKRVKLLRLAVSQGAGDSILELSKCFFYGTGVEKNLIEACAYYITFTHFNPKLKTNPYYRIIENYDIELDQALTDEQIEAARLRAQEVTNEIVNQARKKWKGSLALLIIGG